MEFTEQQIHNSTAKQILYDIDFYTSGQITPCREEYNGWCNYDTWKFNLNISNIYSFTKELEAQINNMSLKDFVTFCLVNKHIFVDTINFLKVDFKEVYTAWRDN